MTDRELMQMALDALEEYVGVVVSVNDPNDWTPKVADAGEPARKAIEALRARLAEPEQEPVAWMHDSHVGFNVPLYTAPPQREWQTLTENEIKHLWYEACQTNLELTSQLIVHLARNIEAKLKEKNT